MSEMEDYRQKVLDEIAARAAVAPICIDLLDGTSRGEGPTTMSLDRDGCDADVGDVVSFQLSEDHRSVEMKECCDYYFYADLNREQFGKLVAYLVEMHKKMKP